MRMKQELAVFDRRWDVAKHGNAQVPAEQTSSLQIVDLGFGR
jgi:hypothetical protein